MSKPDRVSIDITGLRDQIEGCQRDPIWKELTLTKKIRILVQEALETRRRSVQKEPPRKS